MDLEIDLNKIIQEKAKTAGKDLAKELSEYMKKNLDNYSKSNSKDNVPNNIERKNIKQENNNVNVQSNKETYEFKTEDSKAKYQVESRKIIKQYGDIYEVKNGEEKHYNINSEYPEFIKQTELKDGYYIMQNENLEYKEDLTQSINKSLMNLKNSIATEEKDFLKNCRVNGAEYKLDEIGDDEKYIYLTKVSDNTEFQEYDISDELYNSLLKDNRDEIYLTYNNGKYEIK